MHHAGIVPKLLLLKSGNAESYLMSKRSNRPLMRFSER